MLSKTLKLLGVCAGIVYLLAGCRQYTTPQAVPENLTCEYLKDPLGIDVIKPRLSWISSSQTRGFMQHAYRILVSSSINKLNKDAGDIWDSGKIESDSSINIRYNGMPLQSGGRYFWKVKLWNNTGEESGWSSVATWSVGLLDTSDWKGKWIGNDEPMPGDNVNAVYTRVSARYLRKDFASLKKVKAATAYLCGLGLSELYINGKKIGDAVLSPALAEYPKRAWYTTYDVTNDIKQGRNAFGILLGNGRFVGVRVKPVPVYYDNNFITKLTHYGMPKAIGQIAIEYTDGTHQTIYTDTDWKLTNQGPIITNNEFDGEEYDATKELTGWSEAGYNDKEWQNARHVKPGALQLSAQMTPPIKVMNKVKPIAVFERAPGVFIFDMGQNMVGWVNLKVQGKRGQKVAMRFAEVLKPDSNLNLAPIRTAKVTDAYTLKGIGIESWQPRFVYHGFRYVEVRGYPGKPSLDAITGMVVHDALEEGGTFVTSNAVINKIFNNAKWGIKGNYRSIPTDCPQRDERQGWLGDRATGSRGESYLFNNAPLYAKWLRDINDAQTDSGSIPDVAPSYWQLNTDNITWPAAYIIIANMLYEQFGNREPLIQHYASMNKWMDFIRNKRMTNYIIEFDQYGDWCVPPDDPSIIMSKDPKRKSDGAVLSTAYYYHLCGIMERFARLNNNMKDAGEYANLQANIKKAYNARFFDIKRNAYTNNTATTNGLSLFFGLTPGKSRQAVFNNMVNTTMRDFNGHVSTGLIGVQFLMRTLTHMGRPDVAYKLATNKDYPGWGYMVENGATTIWELWNGNTADPFMNSGNHVMLLGDLVIWYFEDLAGIKPDANTPGFKKIIMKPTPVADLTFVKASHKSPYGWIRSEWEIKNGSFTWNITVPANTTAKIYVPAKSEEDVYEGSGRASKADGVKLLGAEGGRVVYEVGAGSYKFSAVIKK
ncbi:glycoside hydrolase family 78 protein [Mucilaginibacter hurinus]|nr:glycoside hydrolase family 78 protein [Mucilaginibacter hurinus]